MNMASGVISLTNPGLLRAVEAIRAQMQARPELVREADEVIRHYGQLFRPDKLPSLSAEEFTEFLDFRNNHQWYGLDREAGTMTADMPRLREALAILLDDSKPLVGRLRKLRPAVGEPFVKGLSRAVITASLLVAYPEKYGVLNRSAEQVMKAVGIYPDVSPEVDFADQYMAVKEVLLAVSKEFSLPLWFVDKMWSQIHNTDGDSEPVVTQGSETSFGLEQHLREFLLDNWRNLEISKEWDLLERDGEIVGWEYWTDLGSIDLLARHVMRPEWLVIELKRESAADRTIGRILRFMGWVQKNLARKETVKGLIIAGEKDPDLEYALSQVPNVAFKMYRLRLELVSTMEMESYYKV
jgi:hypothetical protein